MTEEERRRRLIAMGLDPTKYRYVTNAEKAARNLTQGSAFTTGVGSAIGPALGGIAGGAVPLALASGPVGWGALGLSVLGGLAGGYLGGKAQEGLEGAAYDDETLRELQLRRQAAYEKYPKTTFAGQVAPSLLAFRPSLTTLKSLPGAVVNAPLRTQTALQRYALTSAGVGGGLEAGVEAGSQALRGEDLDLGRIAMAGALGATLTEPTRMYGRLGATIGRTGQSGKDFLEARGMTRPLADDDPRLLEELQVARETVEKERTQQRREKERLKETAEQSAQKDSKPTPEQKKPTTPHEDEIISRQLDEDIKNAEAEKEKAEAADLEAVKKNPPKGLRPTQVEHRDAVERLTNLYNQRARVAGETKEQSTRADDLWNKHQRRQAGISGKDPLPPPKDLLKAAKGFAARQGMLWEEKVIDMAKRASDDQYRGRYDVHTHTAQLSTLAKEDTPWHEYLHGIWQVLKRSGDHKHRQLIKIFEDDILKVDGVPLSAEEPIVELGGRALERRMNDVSKDGKIARWFKDWRLERDARKGFPKKEGEKNDEYLGRLADWLAMRGERAPAMQPKQLKAFLRDLPVRHANDGFDSVEGGFRYSKDVPQPSEAPDEMRSRVGNIIRESLAATKADNISKGHIQNLIAAAKNADKISDEDTKWNSQLLDSLYSYEGRKIPRETVEEFLDAFEYRVTTLENRRDFPKPPLTAEEIEGIAPTYIAGGTEVLIGNPAIDGKFRSADDIDRIRFIADPKRRESGLPFIKPKAETEAEARWFPKYMTEAEAIDYTIAKLNEERAGYGKIPSESGYLPHEGIAMIQGENYKIRALRMPDKYTDPEYIGKGGHEEFGAGKNTVGWTRSNEQYLVSDKSKSRHIVEAQADLHQEGKALGYGAKKDDVERHHVLHMESWSVDPVERIGGPRNRGLGLESDVYTLKPFRLASSAKYGPLFKLPEQVQVSQAEINAEVRELGERMEEIAEQTIIPSRPLGEQPKHHISTLRRLRMSKGTKLKNWNKYLSDNADLIKEWEEKSKLKEKLESFNPVDRIAVHNVRIRNKLKKDPEFTYGGYKFKYDEATDVLEQTPYEQKFTEADLDVVLARAEDAESFPLHYVKLPKFVHKAFTHQEVGHRWGQVFPDEFPSRQAFWNATREDVIAAWMEESKHLFTHGPISENLGPARDGMKLDYSTDGSSFEAVIKPWPKSKEKVIPDVPFKGNKYVSALARDTVMSAVRERNESVTWPATIEEINATQGYGEGFKLGVKTGKPSTNYNLYVHGKQTSPDGTQTHNFKGDGSYKQSLLDEAFEKIIKDFKRFGPKGWKVEEDALMYRHGGAEGSGIRKPLRPEEVEALETNPISAEVIKTIKVHRFRIPPALRDMLLREGGIESPRYQRVTSEELNDALKIASLHDTSVQYSKRVRSKMMERIKAGTYSVAQGQKVLARFASRPFPSDMRGEEIAQVINGLEMYHGSPEAEAIRREGFKGEELSPSGLVGRGVYLTFNKELAASFGGTAKVSLADPNLSVKDFSNNIPIRTSFKKLLDLDQTHTNKDVKDFYNKYKTVAKKLNYEIIPDVDSRIQNRLEETDNLKYSSLVSVLEMTQVAGLPTTDMSRGIAITGNDRRNRILNEMGYDGLTYMFTGDREVVAFREPFEAATDQLHEYYGGERLQSVDDILKDTNDYQISSATDHFSSNPIIKNAWFVDSVVDKIRAHGKNDEERKISNMVADALDAAARDANRLEGEFGEGFLFAELGNVNLNREDARHVARYMVLTRRGRADEIPADTLARYNEPDSPVRHYVDYFKKQYKEVRDRQIAAGMKITDKDGKAREPGQDEDYYPELLNQEMRRELTGEKGASLRQQREDELVNWWLENAAENQEGEPLFTEKDARQAASAYIEKLTGNSNFIGSTHFAALRKAEGIGLPTTLDADGNFLWIDNSAANTYTRYMRRFARDFAFYTNVENNPTVAMVLGIKNQEGKAPGLTPELQKINPFYLAVKDDETGGGWRAKSATKDANIQDYIKGYLGYYDGQELVGRTANRLIVSHWLGAMSGVRDIMSSFVHALPYMRLSDAPAIAGAIRDFGKSWTKSHLTGVNRSQYNRLEFATETSNRLADGINRWADLMTVVTGRNILERSTRAFQFSLGRMVAMRQLQAEAGDVTANRTLARLQQMSGVNTKKLRGKMASEEQLDRLAAAWVELNQGTYDVRGVPNWTLYGPASMFTSLGRWNIEKFNRMRKDVMDPAIDDGDFRPLIKATLGTVITGTLLVEIAEFINNKFNSNPTLLESAKEGNTEEAAYAVADLMNQVGYFGIMSALLNDTAIQFSRGERIRSGGVVFPAYDFFANSLSEPLFDANDAVKEGADFWPTYTRAITDVLKNTTQTYRIVWNQTFGREETEKKNIRRDLRIFRRFEGERAATQPRGVGNPYLRPDTREFKESDTLGKAVETLPAAFEEQRERAAGRGDKLKEYTSGLYTIPEKGMPAIATTEGVDEFLRYRDYIMRQRGSGRWDRMFEDWARRKQLTATKKALVKSYVAHLMQTQRAR